MHLRLVVGEEVNISSARKGRAKTIAMPLICLPDMLKA